MSSPIRLLYIDDDPALVRLVQRQLARRGYVVEASHTGEEGIGRIASGGIDAVALDHYMPGQDGLATLTRIRDLPDPPPVIYVTGTNESSIAIAALKSGAADYVVKDVQGAFYDLLDAALHSAIESNGLRRAKRAAEREIREARDRFEALAAERQVLMREVNHRVGNSLQLVAAFLHMQATSAAPETKAALSEANRRVLAIAQVHRRLYSSDDVKSVALHQYLAGLIEDIRQSADAEGTAALLVLQADEVDIAPDDAVTIGIIVTELVINAMKYAYPDGHGPIRVSLSRHRTGRVPARGRGRRGRQERQPRHAPHRHRPHHHRGHGVQARRRRRLRDRSAGHARHHGVPPARTARPRAKGWGSRLTSAGLILLPTGEKVAEGRMRALEQHQESPHPPFRHLLPASGADDNLKTSASTRGSEPWHPCR